MGKIAVVLVVMLLVVIGGGAIFLSTWDIPAPTKTVEKTIDDASLPH